MSAIFRNPGEAEKRSYDAIIIGGGIYGIMLSFIASQRGLKTLLLEKNDFGGATSYNHLKILHGGFRYLQSLDLPRFFESVGERRWFMQNFDPMVKPLPCLMPLYNSGIYRTSIFRAALKLNDILSFRRNVNLSALNKLSSGKIINTKEVIKNFPGVDKIGLKGGAVWYDCLMPDSQRIVIELLKHASSSGSTALNYCKAISIIKNGNSIEGIEAVDLENNRTHIFKSKVVINSAGPWARELALAFDKDYEQLFKPSIAWNVLFDRKAISDYALAITPKKIERKTYFLTPWKNLLFAGTIHEPWEGSSENPKPSEKSVKNFIDDLNFAIPGINLSTKDILHIYAGLMPARKNGGDKPAVREVIIDHSESGGLKGLFSISGVKFTTARLVAEKTISKIFHEVDKQNNSNLFIYKNIKINEQGIFSYDWYPEDNNEDWKRVLKNIIHNESVVHLDDLILRRTSIGDNPDRALKSAYKIVQLFNWSEKRIGEEIDNLERSFINPFNKGIKSHKSLAIL